MIKAEIIKDSVTPWGKRLTTFVLIYPRFIHSEFMTHRMLSRNASSSRAIPVEKMIESVKENLVYPIQFTSNKKGMQGGADLPVDKQERIIELWDVARKAACELARQIANHGLHKQYASRLIEPFAHISVICTATEFDNFFALRRHPDAQPEIHALADAMWKEYDKSIPIERAVREWHLPFVDECSFATEEDLLLAIHKSVASCARVSYRNHDLTTPTDAQNKELHDRLLARNPIHASPAEHQGVVGFDAVMPSGNFRGGWIQYRKMISNECVERYLG